MIKYGNTLATGVIAGINASAIASDRHFGSVSWGAEQCAVFFPDARAWKFI
jgi:hypothetical protein